MSPELLSGLISGASGLLGAIGLFIGIWTRRLSREAKELRELREVNRAALAYIYELEIASDEAARKAGVKIQIEKPEVLRFSYLQGRADEGNAEMGQIVDFVKKIGPPGSHS